MYNDPYHKCATIFTRHLGANIPIKYVLCLTVGISLHVYKGSPFIWCLLHCAHPHFIV